MLLPTLAFSQSEWYRDPTAMAEEALLQAKDVLLVAAARSDDTYIRKMKSKSRRVRVQKSQEYSCLEGAWAYVMTSYFMTDNNLYVCDIFGNDGNPRHALHVILHELAHLAGVSDEDAANQKAREVLKLVAGP